MVQSEAGVIRKSRGQLKSPLLVPSGLRKTVHSSMWPKGWNRRLTSSSPCCLPSIPTNSFRSSGDKSRSHLGTLSPLGLCRGTEEPRKGANHGLALGRRGGNEKALFIGPTRLGFFEGQDDLQMDLEERNSGFPSGKLESWKNSDSWLLLWEVSQSLVFGWIKPYMHLFMFALYVLRVWEILFWIISALLKEGVLEES